MEQVLVLASSFLVFAAALVGFMTKLEKVHVLVNSRMAETLERIKQLEASLKAAGVAVPATPKRGEVDGAE